MVKKKRSRNSSLELVDGASGYSLEEEEVKKEEAVSPKLEEGSSSFDLISDFDFDQFVSAVDALRKHQAELDASGRLSFADDPDIVELEIEMKKVPGAYVSNRSILQRIALPHGHRPPNATVCFICGDKNPIDHRKADVDEDARQMRHRLEFGLGLPRFDEVISLNQFKREYSTRESRLKLARAFDLFLAEFKVNKAFLRCCGSEFWRVPRSLPYLINVDEDKPKELIEKWIDVAKRTTTMKLMKTSIMTRCRIGRLDFSSEQWRENLEEIFDTLQRKLPGGLKNVRLMSLFSSGVSTRLPCYLNLDSRNNVVLPLADTPVTERYIEDELTTIVPDDTYTGRIRVYPDGRVHLMKRKGKRTAAELADLRAAVADFRHADVQLEEGSDDEKKDVKILSVEGDEFTPTMTSTTRKSKKKKKSVEEEPIEVKEEVDDSCDVEKVAEPKKKRKRKSNL